MAGRGVCQIETRRQAQEADLMGDKLPIYFADGMILTENA